MVSVQDLVFLTREGCANTGVMRSRQTRHYVVWALRQTTA
jgi:hypothetical protein